MCVYYLVVILVYKNAKISAWPTFCLVCYIKFQLPKCLLNLEMNQLKRKLVHLCKCVMVGSTHIKNISQNGGIFIKQVTRQHSVSLLMYSFHEKLCANTPIYQQPFFTDLSVNIAILFCQGQMFRVGGLPVIDLINCNSHTIWLSYYVNLSK